MRKAGTSDVVIILMVITSGVALFLYYISHNFQLPMMSIGQQRETKGFIFRQGVSLQGRSTYQGVNYIFEEKGIWYTGRSRLGKQEGLQQVGDEITVNYSVSNPQNSEMISTSGVLRYRKVWPLLNNQTKKKRRIDLSENLLVYYPDERSVSHTKPYIATVLNDGDSLKVIRWIKVLYDNKQVNFTPIGHPELDTLDRYKLGWKFRQEEFGFQ